MPNPSNQYASLLPQLTGDQRQRLRDDIADNGIRVPIIVDEHGNIRPIEHVALPPGSRLLITVLEPEAIDTALLSEASLAADWDRPEEEAAWGRLRLPTVTGDLAEGLDLADRARMHDRLQRRG